METTSRIRCGLKGCKPDVRKEATQWDASAPSLEDGVAFALLGPLGVLLNRAPTGYDSLDVEEVLEAKAEVVKQIGILKRRITSAAKKQSKLKEQEKICKIILQKIAWYEDTFSSAALLAQKSGTGNRIQRLRPRVWSAFPSQYVAAAMSTRIER